MSKTLQELLQYSNPDIISRFTDLFDIPEQEADDIFNETKKFLFISRMPGVFIPDELLIVDEMWHNFILFTKEYQQFCQLYFGAYLHHTPATKAAKQLHRENIATDLAGTRKAFNEKLAVLMSVTYEQLGKDTVGKWFQAYPVKYSKEAIKKLRKN
jgi:hypothetical protein